MGYCVRFPPGHSQLLRALVLGVVTIASCGPPSGRTKQLPPAEAKKETAVGVAPTVGTSPSTTQTPRQEQPVLSKEQCTALLSHMIDLKALEQLATLPLEQQPTPEDTAVAKRALLESPALTECMQHPMDSSFSCIMAAASVPALTRCLDTNAVPDAF